MASSTAHHEPTHRSPSLTAWHQTLLSRPRHHRHHHHAQQHRTLLMRTAAATTVCYPEMSPGKAIHIAGLTGGSEGPHQPNMVLEACPFRPTHNSPVCHAPRMNWTWWACYPCRSTSSMTAWCTLAQSQVWRVVDFYSSWSPPAVMTTWTSATATCTWSIGSLIQMARTSRPWKPMLPT